MPKLKTHKGMKKRFKVSANGKVSHKRCGSSHLMSHKSGKQVRRLRKKTTLKVTAEARRIRFACSRGRTSTPRTSQAHKLASLHPHPAEPASRAPATTPAEAAFLSEHRGRSRSPASTWLAPRRS